MKIITTVLFVVMCLAQWLVPANMIYDSERVIREGKTYRFKTMPVDPSDPFRGKYITLSFDADVVLLTDNSTWTPGEEVYVTFTTDSAGFALADAISRDKPAVEDYLKTTVSYTTSSPYSLVFDLPFDRYYLEESKASQAEQAYWKAQTDSTQVTYGLVAMGAGTAVLKDVMINEKSIVEVVNELNARDE